MTHKYSLMILSKDVQQYNELIQSIRFDELGLFLLPYMPESQDPFSALQLLNPNIVIVDEALLNPDAIKHIQRMLPSRFMSRFIVLYSGEKDMSHISIQLGTSVSIEKTTVDKTLHLHLARAIKRLMWNSEHRNFVYEATRLYFNTVYLQSIASTQSIQTVNESFGFTFQEGLFRVLIVKLDCSNDPRTVYGQLFPLQKRIEETIHAHFMNYCFEVVLCRTFDGVIITLNFSREADRQIAALIDQVFQQIQVLCSTISGITATLCMGKIYDSIVGVCKSRVDAHNVLWGRLVLGRERILCTMDCTPLQFPLHMEAKYEALRYRILKAFDTLDISNFVTCAGEIFDAPDYVLGSSYIGDFLHNLTLDFFRIHREEIMQFSDVEILKNKTVYVLIMTPDIKEYQKVFTTEFSDLMYQIILQKNKNFSSYVQNAISYVKEHYAKSITLSQIADSIGISTSYLSSTFKTETGTGLSNYISFYRIQAACRMLRETNDPITLIAEKVNISDTTYFSKQFRKYVGTTPSEYRKIFN